jgi:ATP-dependent Lon protease
MVKLLYPDQNFTDEEAYELIEFAAECRKRVKDQLYVVDETFTAEPAKFEYINVKTGEKHMVKTLEQIENDFLPAHEQSLPDDETSELPDTTVGKTSSNSEPVSEAETPSAQSKPKHLTQKFIEIRANQSNVSYKRLFGDYLETASHIIITDPYIRAPFQIDNLVEFIQTARECCTNNEELNIELHTKNDDDKVSEMMETFDELKDELAAVGIEFSYFFDADHDRNIVLDNGWKITLSRGLDIFEKFGRFSLGSVRQTNRRCRAFSATFVQE